MLYHLCVNLKAAKDLQVLLEASRDDASIDDMQSLLSTCIVLLSALREKSLI